MKYPSPKYYRIVKTTFQFPPTRGFIPVMYTVECAGEDPKSVCLDDDWTIVKYGLSEDFCAYNWKTCALYKLHTDQETIEKYCSLGILKLVDN